MNKLIKSILCFIFMFARSPLQINGLAGPVCMVEQHDGMTVLEAKQAISAQTDIPVAGMDLVSDEKLANKSLLDPDVSALSMVLVCPFVSAQDTEDEEGTKYSELTFADPYYSRCLGFDSGYLHQTYFGERQFPCGDYDMATFFDKACNLWMESKYNEDKMFPGLLVSFEFGILTVRFNATQHVFEKMRKTNILDMLYDEKLLYDEKQKNVENRDMIAGLFYLAMRCLGAKHEGIVRRDLKCTYLTRDDFYNMRDADGNIPQVSRKLVDFMDNLLKEYHQD